MDTAPSNIFRPRFACVFLIRRVALQENASKPEGLPPSLGGKYVGFGSQLAQPPKQNAAGEDYSAMLSKGFSQLSTVAGEAYGLFPLLLKFGWNSTLG